MAPHRAQGIQLVLPRQHVTEGASRDDSNIVVTPGQRSITDVVLDPLGPPLWQQSCGPALCNSQHFGQDVNANDFEFTPRQAASQLTRAAHPIYNTPSVTTGQARPTGYLPRAIGEEIVVGLGSQIVGRPLNDCAPVIWACHCFTPPGVRDGNVRIIAQSGCRGYSGDREGCVLLCA
jgi:hypothetical protein